MCSLSSSETLRHGQLGYAVADWRRAAVHLKVWVSGKTLTLKIANVDLSDWSRAARTLVCMLLLSYHLVCLLLQEQPYRLLLGANAL